MDPIASIVNGQQDAVLSQIQYAVAGKILRDATEQGNAAVQLIDAASNTAAAATTNLLAGANGIGGAIDITG